MQVPDTVSAEIVRVPLKAGRLLPGQADLQAEPLTPTRSRSGYACAIGRMTPKTERLTVPSLYPMIARPLLDLVRLQATPPCRITLRPRVHPNPDGAS